MTRLAAQEARIAEWLGTQREAMLALLADLVNIDSGSYDKAGVDAVGRRLVAFFAQQGLVTSTEPHETFGDAIHVGSTTPAPTSGRSCSWATATPSFPRARSAAARSASRADAPTARVSPT